MVFAGWRKVDTLEDRTISVWGKDDVPPATSPSNAPQMPPPWQGLMWGILPIWQQHPGPAVPADIQTSASDTSPKRSRRRYGNLPPPKTWVLGRTTLVMRGWLLALIIVVVTAILITIGTLWPVQTAIAMATAAPDE
jgi:hypothetical protein